MAWESKTKLFGLPLVSVGFFAKGIIAIGFSGVGVITIAQFGGGIIAFTQFGFGIFSVAQFSLGVVAVAQLGIGLLYAFGQAVLGFIATGIDAAGWYVITDSADVINNTRDLLAMVKADPMPMVYYLVLWGISITCFYMQKHKITSDMKIWDLFRPMIRHTDYRIRARAVTEETDNNRLFRTALADPHDMVAAAALKRIDDQRLLARFVRESKNEKLRFAAVEKISDTVILLELLDVAENRPMTAKLVEQIRKDDILVEIIRKRKNPLVRAEALLRMADPDPSFLRDLAMVETGSDMIAALMMRITDNNVIAHIAKKAASPLARSSAVKELTSPDTNFLMGIINSGEVFPVKASALERLADQALLQGIAAGHPEPRVRIQAVSRVDDRVMVKSLLDTENDETVLRAIHKRLNETEPFYHALKLELVCPHCSQPVFVNGPLRETSCTFCQSDVPLREFWNAVKGSSSGITRELSRGLVIEKSRKKPGCSECGSPLETDFITAASDTDENCGSCGSRFTSLPVPEHFRWSKNADHIFCAERDGDDDSARKKTKPVSISCIKCGAPLEVTAETPRNAKCGYCNTIQYLPDPLWLSFHPVKTKREWYIRSKR